jgi:hypothetical protein
MLMLTLTLGHLHAAVDVDGCCHQNKCSCCFESITFVQGFKPLSVIIITIQAHVHRCGPVTAVLPLAGTRILKKMD